MIVLSEADFRQRLTEYLEAVTEEAITLVTLRPLAGGASRDNWLVEARLKDELHRWVLRRDMASVMYEKALERDQEFQVMKAAYVSGVQSPCPRWFCLEPMILGAPFMILDYAEGISIGAQVVELPELADARRKIPEALGQQLARIHALDPRQHGLDFLPEPRPGFSPAQEALFQTRAALIKLGEHNPTLAFGLRWAEQNVPRASTTVLLHGDFRVGNFLVTPQGLNGIIDWEFSRIGDPLEDLAWICLRDWRYGQGEKRLGGIGDREPFIRAYEQASGRKIDRQAVDFWEIVGNLRWAVTCLAQANRHLTGGDESVELASLGRRSAEMQLEMLRLIAEQGL